MKYKNKTKINKKNRPQDFSVGFRGVPELLKIDTPPHVLSSRLTANMEQWLMFILTKVPLGQQKRHQSWFSDKYVFVCGINVRGMCCGM